MGRIFITEEELDQSIFQFGHSKEGVREKRAQKLQLFAFFGLRKFYAYNSTKGP